MSLCPAHHPQCISQAELLSKGIVFCYSMMVCLYHGIGVLYTDLSVSLSKDIHSLAFKYTVFMLYLVSSHSV